MGIYDRDYMKAGQPAKGWKSAGGRKDKTSLSFWNRFKFRLWLIFHPGRMRTKNRRDKGKQG